MFDVLRTILGGLRLVVNWIACSPVLSAILVACQEQDSPVPSQTSSITPHPIYAQADAGVMSNDEWTPYSEEIDGVLMALVPSGCFLMGSTDDQIDYPKELVGSAAGLPSFEDQGPAHMVCFVEPFWIDVYEVSQTQFAEKGGGAVNGCYFTGDHLPRVAKLAEQPGNEEVAGFVQNDQNPENENKR